MSILSHCTLCPRECLADREGGGRGYCGASKEIKIARAALHMWEEPPISGKNGSGTVFFSGCPLSCVFCQNREISHGAFGKEISEDRLIEIFFELKDAGAHNINLVTPTHFAPQIAKALTLAKERGLALPIVYNCGGYESVEALKLLEGLVDIYLPDFKYMSPTLAEKYSHAKDYPEKAKAALSEMVRQNGVCELDENGIMRRGTLVRHLVLPSHTDDSIEVLKYLHATHGDKIYISIMNQYTPTQAVKRDFSELSRKLTTYEYEKVLRAAKELGITRGFTQYGGTASESFIPLFDLTGVDAHPQ